MSSTGSEATLNISPKPPAPLYPDVPWWAVLITAFVFSIVGVLAGIYGYNALQGKPGMSMGDGSAASIIVDTVSYMPHILLLFGVLADMFTLDGVWSIPSLIGILSIFANYVFQYFWKGIEELVRTGKEVGTRAFNKEGAGTPPPGAAGNEMGLRGGKQSGGKVFDTYSGCHVQGFSGFATPYAPQTLVVTATVFSYYCFDLIRNRGWINSIAAILAFLGAFVGQTAVIDLMNKNPDGTTCDKSPSPIAGAVRALFEGLMFGGIGYGVVQTYAPTRLPSSTISPFPRKTAADLSPGPDGKMYDKDGYPYVILPNGQAVPDISSAKARAAFGQMAGGASGSTTSLGSNCPGVAAACPNATA
jgi:hypothetical protein